MPEGWTFERSPLETGDIALAALPDAGVVERKTASDLVSCIGAGRERFEKELKRGRYCGRMVVVVEGTLDSVIGAARGVYANAVIGTISAWVMRYCPIIFCGSQQLAAEFSFRFLACQVRDIQRSAKAIL